MKKTLALATVALLAGISLAAAQQTPTKSKTTDTEPGAASSAGGPAQQNKGTGMSGTTGSAPMAAPASTSAPKSSTDNPKNLNAQDKNANPSTGSK